LSLIPAPQFTAVLESTFDMAASRAEFQRDLREAFAQQHHEYEQSMNNLFSRVALLCEHTSPTSQSRALLAEEFHGISMCGKDPHLQQTVTTKDASDDENTDPDRRIPFKREMSRSSSFDANGIETIMQENHIKHLSFIQDTGEILEPPTAIERICGPSYAAVKAHMMSPFECCRPRSGRFADFVDGIGFKLITMTVIVLNFVFIIAQSDYRARHVGEAESCAMLAFGYSFTAFYVLELCALVFVHGKYFFVGPDMGWNLFDTAVVLAAIADILMAWLGFDGFNMSFLRVLRFFKISRVLRMFSALRTVKEIRIMVDALVGCLSIFLFCGALMAIFLCVFAIFFVQGVTELLKDQSHLDAGLVADLRTDWSSVSGVMLQLFMTITGGCEWTNAYSIVKEVGDLHASLFLFFVAFYYIAFFNVITSVFCEKAMSLATPTTPELISKRIQKEHNDALELMALLKHSLKDDTCYTINAQQIIDFVNDPEVELYFDVRGLKSSSAHKLYRMLCEVHCTDNIKIGEFISALIKLDGTANSIDAHCLQVRQMHGLYQMKAAQEIQNDEIAGLRGAIEDLQQSQSVPVAVETALSPPLSTPLHALLGKDVLNESHAEALPALPAMNETLKVLKHLVHKSMGVSAVGDDALDVVKQLVPMCCGSAIPDHEHSFHTHLDSGKAALQEEHFEHDAIQLKTVRETIYNELLEMRQTLEEIQQGMPVLSQSQSTASAHRDPRADQPSTAKENIGSPAPKSNLARI
jgi:hypothetical protein